MNKLPIKLRREVNLEATVVVERSSRCQRLCTRSGAGIKRSSADEVLLCM
jgi:hypothetical protein